MKAIWNRILSGSFQLEMRRFIIFEGHFYHFIFLDKNVTQIQGTNSSHELENDMNLGYRGYTAIRAVKYARVFFLFFLFHSKIRSEI